MCLFVCVCYCLAFFGLPTTFIFMNRWFWHGFSLGCFNKRAICNSTVLVNKQTKSTKKHILVVFNFHLPDCTGPLQIYRKDNVYSRALESMANKCVWWIWIGHKTAHGKLPSHLSKWIRFAHSNAFVFIRTQQSIQNHSIILAYIFRWDPRVAVAIECILENGSHVKQMVENCKQKWT